jgi:hypothetical protein
MDIHFLLFSSSFSVRTAHTAGLPGGHSGFQNENAARNDGGGGVFTLRSGFHSGNARPFRETATAW